MARHWSNKTVLITGGTGTFGHEFVTRYVDEFAKIVVLSRDEFKQFNMRRDMFDRLGKTSSKINYLIGDIRDLERLKTAFRGVDLVINAAALKHVPVCEYNPQEAIKTNVLGTMNVCNAAIEMDVPQVVHVSTDKAVDPINMYGSTKNTAEKYVISSNSYSRNTILSCVRYGNIIGSRGSIIETVKRAMTESRDGKFKVTEEDMTRFWMSIEEAAKLVMHGASHAHGGEIFVPHISSAKTLDVVRDIYTKMGRDFSYEVIGTRGGEKLHESLLSPYETGRTSTSWRSTGIYVVRPENPQWDSTLSSRLIEDSPLAFAWKSYNSNDDHCLQRGGPSPSEGWKKLSDTVSSYLVTSR